jgi:alpha-galactosidase
MKALADYVHARGMLLGLYTCVGTETCKKNRPGSYGYYQTDANTMAKWEVDMVKADYCNKPANETGKDLYAQFSKALNSTGRPMLFAMCQWGDDEVWDWAPDIAQMYRVQMDHMYSLLVIPFSAATNSSSFVDPSGAGRLRFP